MCGRFYIDHDADAFFADGLQSCRNRNGLILSRRADAEPVDVRPMDTATVIANNRRHELTAFPMQWGYHLENGRLLINVRSETAAQKAMFAENLRLRRCAVPLSGYYEWRQSGRERMKYAIHPENHSPVFLAGLYRMEEQRPVFTILTREAAPGIAHIHHRMPVLLSRADAAQWLHPAADAEQIMMRASILVQPSLLEGTEPLFDMFPMDSEEGIPAGRGEIYP